MALTQIHRAESALQRSEDQHRCKHFPVLLTTALRVEHLRPSDMSSTSAQFTWIYLWMKWCLSILAGRKLFSAGTFFFLKHFLYSQNAFTTCANFTSLLSQKTEVENSLSVFISWLNDSAPRHMQQKLATPFKNLGLESHFGP